MHRERISLDPQLTVTGETLAKTFVGNLKSYTQRCKYFTRHVALSGKEFGFENISVLMMFPTPKYYKVILTIKEIYNENGTMILSIKVVK